MNSISSGVALMPVTANAGSPGRTFISKKERMLITQRTKIEETTRVPE